MSSSSTLRDRDGVRHLALAPNDAAAWWTPIACGGGICLPGHQTDEPVDCPDCLTLLSSVPRASEAPTSSTGDTRFTSTHEEPPLAGR